MGIAEGAAVSIKQTKHLLVPALHPLQYRGQNFEVRELQRSRSTIKFGQGFVPSASKLLEKKSGSPCCSPIEAQLALVGGTVGEALGAYVGDPVVGETVGVIVTGAVQALHDTG